MNILLIIPFVLGIFSAAKIGQRPFFNHIAGFFIPIILSILGKNLIIKFFRRAQNLGLFT